MTFRNEHVITSALFSQKQKRLQLYCQLVFSDNNVGDAIYKQNKNPQNQLLLPSSLKHLYSTYIYVFIQALVKF